MSTTINRNAPAAPRRTEPPKTAAKPKPAAAVKPAKPATAPSAAAPPPPPPAQDPPRRSNGLFDSLGLGNLTNRLRGPELTDQQRNALRNVRSMLEPDKLGGADRTFNYADRDAVVNGLMRDRNGLSAEVQARLRAEGHPFQANQARRGLEGQRGLLPQMARNRIAREAPGQIAGQVTQGLQNAGIDPATGAQRDQTPRNLTFAELRRFEGDARVLEQMQRATEDRLNVDIRFPNGPNQAAIDFLLEGRLGIPPGAVITPRQRR